MFKNAIKYGWPFAVVLILWAASYHYVPIWFGAPKGSAEFGDMFGAVNALFAGLAFAGVIVTVWMQKDELELQRKEIRDNGLIMKAQEEQLSLQRETMQRQQFEATFFQMLGLILRKVEQSKVEYYGMGDSPFVFAGEKAFSHLETTVIGTLTSEAKSLDGESRPRMEWVPISIQTEAFSALKTLCPFFQSMDATLEHIERHSIDQNIYDEILRVHLFPMAAFWIAVRGLYSEAIKNRIEKHGLLKYMSDDHLYAFTSLDYYSPVAFGGVQPPTQNT